MNSLLLHQVVYNSLKRLYKTDTENELPVRKKHVRNQKPLPEGMILKPTILNTKYE